MRFVSYMTPGFPVSLFEVMADRIDAELHLEQELSGPPPGEDPFADGRYDLGWVCSTSYVDMALRAERPSVQLAGVAWVPDDPDVGGRPVYYGDVVVGAGSAVRSIDDLAGLRIGCNDVVSLSGHVALRIAIAERGHDPDTFADLTFTGGHHASLDKLIAGELDAAVVDSVVRTGRARRDAAVAGLRVVERLGPWPVQPLVASATLPAEEVRRVQATLLAANDLAAELEAAALTRLVPVGDDHYEPVRRAMTAGRT